MQARHNKQDPIIQTQAWIERVVMGCGFCPFAKTVYENQKIHYKVTHSTEPYECFAALVEACVYLDGNDHHDTGFVIYTAAYPKFKDYLEAVEMAEALLKKQAYQGVYQLASFHPDYCFAQQSLNDPANYTNRSPFPMFHILRESSIETALLSFSCPEAIPERNIAVAREKGVECMRTMLDDCRGIK